MTELKQKYLSNRDVTHWDVGPTFKILRTFLFIRLTVFFLSARESHLRPFFQFFHGTKKQFQAHFWPIFQFFHGHFSLFFVFLIFFHQEKMYFHGQKFYSFCGKVFNLAGYLSKFFHVPQFEFHGHDFIKISRASLSFHGNFFRVFQSFSRAFSFSRATGFFFTGTILIFTGKKHWKAAGP